MGDPTGLTLPVAIEELFWGDAGIGLSIFGSGLAAAGIAGNGTPEQVDRVGAAVLRHADDVAARRLLRVRARRRLRRVARCAPGPSTTRPRTSGCSTAPRRGSPTAASPTSTWSSPRSTPSSRAAGQASFIVPPGTHGPVAGPEVQEARHPRLAHRRGRARRRPGARLAACSAARRSSTTKLARAREAPEDAVEQAAGDGDLRGHPPRGRRPGPRHRPGRLRVLASTTPRSARRSASRSS